MDITPGSRLSVGEVADQMGVSRSPVRDAFHLLIAEGLVEYGKTSGYRIIEVNRKYIEDVFVARRSLEPTALRLAVTGSNHQRIAQLRIQWQQLRLHPSQVDAENLANHINADSHLHQSFGEMSGNRVLSDMITKVVSRATWIRRWVYSNNIPASHLTTMADEHLQILDAALVGDVNRAVDLLEQHLVRGQEIALNTFHSGGDTPQKSAEK